MADLPEQSVDEPQYSIHVASVNLQVMPPFMENPNHNYISVRGPDGQELFAFHGLAIDRETGNVVAAGNDEDTLRVLMTTKEVFDIESELEIEAEAEIWRGDEAGLIQKMNMTFDAMNFVNNQNLVYERYAAFSVPQNSNSVAHTLVEAMELDFPEEIERHWTPGHGRILLPEDWRSYYASETLTPEQQAAALIENSGKMAPPINVIQKAITDPVPDEDRPVRFNREEPFGPYVPVGFDGVNTGSDSIPTPQAKP